MRRPGSARRRKCCWRSGALDSMKSRNCLFEASSPQLVRQHLLLRHRRLKRRRVLQLLRKRLQPAATEPGKEIRPLATPEQPEHRDRDIGLRHLGSREPRPGKLSIEPAKTVADLLVAGI